MSETVKVNWSLGIGLVGCKREGVAEFDREAWESMDEDEREEAMKEFALDDLDWNFWEEE